MPIDLATSPTIDAGPSVDEQPSTRAPAGPPPAPRHEPVEIAPDTFVIRATHGEGVAPLTVHMNAMLIRGTEPVVVDTGAPANRERYLDDLFSLVDPEDVRWVFLSHDDGDHWGNVNQVMAACPNATLVTNWFMNERLAVEHFDVPPPRWRWIGDGETFDAGDRTLAAIRPPLYDSPTTRGLFDPTTGVYWASDCYATPVQRGAAWVTELDPDFWAEGFTMFQTWNSPWIELVDDAKFHAACRRIERLGITTIATCHGPAITGPSLDRAHRMLRELPEHSVPPQPGQPVLDEIVAQVLAQHPG